MTVSNMVARSIVGDISTLSRQPISIGNHVPSPSTTLSLHDSPAAAYRAGGQRLDVTSASGFCGSCPVMASIAA